MTKVNSEGLTEGSGDFNLSHVKHLENVIFELRKELRWYKEENKLLKMQLETTQPGCKRPINGNFKKDFYYLGLANDIGGDKSSTTKEIKIDDGEDIDLFLLEEKKAEEAIKKNPLYNPISELKKHSKLISSKK